MKRLVIGAGGTGGHVIPAQEVARELLDHDIPCTFAACALSTNPYFDRKKWAFTDICASPVRFSPVGLASFCGKTVYGVSQAYSLLKNVPLLIGFGSYHTVPLLIAATLRRIPFVLYEANAVPGRVTRLFSPHALWTACFFEEAAKHLSGTSIVVDHPLRRHLTIPLPKEQARKYYNLPLEGNLLLVLGGSQGAECFNTLIPSMMQVLPVDQRPMVLHLAGKVADLSKIRRRYQEIGVLAQVLAYEDHMQYAYSCADIVISRAGASAIAEIASFQKKAIYIPFPKATDDHQKKNALSAAQKYGSVVIDEEKASPAFLGNALHKLLETSFDGVFAPIRQGIVPLLIQELKERSL
jgi:UDP-N-acetylglucosamine--N-acetylmuramyl-(pentapeptide) pyrophosphoryl-undecaprenol N-acetylglucosamine transferase